MGCIVTDIWFSRNTAALEGPWWVCGAHRCARLSGADGSSSILAKVKEPGSAVFGTARYQFARGSVAAGFTRCDNSGKPEFPSMASALESGDQSLDIIDRGFWSGERHSCVGVSNWGSRPQHYRVAG